MQALQHSVVDGSSHRKPRPSKHRSKCDGFVSDCGSDTMHNTHSYILPVGLATRFLCGYRCESTLVRAQRLGSANNLNAFVRI